MTYDPHADYLASMEYANAVKRRDPSVTAELRAAREHCIRSGIITPRLDDEEECRWAREGNA